LFEGEVGMKYSTALIFALLCAVCSSGVSGCSKGDSGAKEPDAAARAQAKQQEEADEKRIRDEAIMRAQQQGNR
jgi:hypothetical protein